MVAKKTQKAAKFTYTERRSCPLFCRVALTHCYIRCPWSLLSNSKGSQEACCSYGDSENTRYAQRVVVQSTSSSPYATLVRKTAEAKKDRLGPQWETWVKKTVHKLVRRYEIDNVILLSHAPLFRRTKASSRHLIQLGV